MKTANFLGSDYLYPIAFRPDTEPARWIIDSSEKELIAKFDFTMSSAPESASIVLVFEENKTPGYINLEFEKNDELKIFIELRKKGKTLKEFMLGKTDIKEDLLGGDNKIKIYDIKPDVDAIVITSWQAANPNVSSVITVRDIT